MTRNSSPSLDRRSFLAAAVAVPLAAMVPQSNVAALPARLVQATAAETEAYPPPDDWTPAEPEPAGVAIAMVPTINGALPATIDLSAPGVEIHWQPTLLAAKVFANRFNELEAADPTGHLCVVIGANASQEGGAA
ncbi:MAG TPA: hypothetical protein VG713_03990 [Pirellulales bacterium]|nr:hypothetical protein [Pirellulales bacterium]